MPTSKSMIQERKEAPKQEQPLQKSSSSSFLTSNEKNRALRAQPQKPEELVEPKRMNDEKSSQLPSPTQKKKELQRKKRVSIGRVESVTTEPDQPQWTELHWIGLGALGLLAAVVVLTLGLRFILLIFLAIVGVVFLWKVWKSQDSESTSKKEALSRDASQADAKDIYLKDIIVQERIGGGEFGEVCRGVWDEATVALKKLKTEQKGSNFVKEIRIFSQLNHPNIVRYYGLYVTPKDKELMIVMEYMSKGGAEYFLKTEGSDLKTEDLLDM